MKNLSLLRMVCIVFVFRAATAIASPAQVLTTLHSFAGPSNEGAFPSAELVQGSDGNFYGTTAWGGASGNCSYPDASGCGTVFKITPNGALYTLHSFNGEDGAAPLAGLVQATDGNFYGTTNKGGASGNCSYPFASGCGTVFKITPSGALTTLHSFELH